jgi:hypothetical protein
MSKFKNSQHPPTTKEWAQSFGISIDPTPPIVEDYDEPCPYTARQIAIRAILLQGVIAVASEVDPEPIMEWFQDQEIWADVTPNERALLLEPFSISEEKLHYFRWQQEAEWALLWVISKVEALGLPTQQCDTRRMVDEIIPPLGSDIEPFLVSAKVQAPGILLAEENRHYDLWCRCIQTRKKGTPMLPSDLDTSVLFHREYAFEWLLGFEEWDNVECDA